MISMVSSSHELVPFTRSAVYLGLNHQNVTKISRMCCDCEAMSPYRSLLLKSLKQSSYQENCKVTTVDLKQTARKQKPKQNKTDCQIFLQQRWVYLGSADNCNLGACNHGEPHASPCTAREGEHFYRGRKKLGGWGGYSKQRVHGFSLTESWPGNKGSLFFFLLGSAIISGSRTLTPLNLLVSHLHVIDISMHFIVFMNIVQRKWIKNSVTRASLVAQWLRVCLPMQGTWVRALVWGDPTCRGVTGPVSHNY